MTKDIKKLTLDELKKQDEKLNKQFEAYVSIGDDVYEVKIDEVFRTSKQGKVLDDMIAFFQEGGKRIELLELATPYTSLLLIKHFTDLEIPDDFDDAIAHLHSLIDLGIFEAVLNELPEKEVIQTYDKLRNVLNEMTEKMEIAQAEADLVAEQLENEVVKKMFIDGEEAITEQE